MIYEDIYKVLSYFMKTEEDNFKSLAYYKAIDSIKTNYENQDLPVGRILDDILIKKKIPRIGKSISEKIIRIFKGELSSKSLENANPHKHYMNRDLAREAINPITKLLDGKYDYVELGSYRREKEVVGDMDLLIADEDYTNLLEVSKLLKSDPNISILAEGEKKLKVKVDEVMEVDIRSCKYSNYGTMLLYFTGSREFNLSMRSKAKEMGTKLSEYGLTIYPDTDFSKLNIKYDLSKYKGEEFMITFESEEKIFDILNIPYVKPKDR